MFDFVYKVDLIESVMDESKIDNVVGLANGLGLSDSN